MPHYKIGDRVQLAGEISRFYACVIGVVTDEGGDPAAALNQYSVRLADGTSGPFFDFQLQNLPASVARVVFDSAALRKTPWTQHSGVSRNLQLVARDVEIRLWTPSGTTNVLAGQVTSGLSSPGCALMTMGQNGQSVTKPANPAGEFEFTDLSEGDITIELVMRDRRVVASLMI